MPLLRERRKRALASNAASETKMGSRDVFFDWAALGGDAPFATEVVAFD